MRLTNVARRGCRGLILAAAVACNGAPVGLEPASALPPAPIDGTGYSGGAVPIDAEVTLDVPTYDGSGQAVHPDVLAFATPWHGWEYWMAFTPYPYAEAALENPSLLVSHDGTHWTAPPGVANPLVPPATRGAYNSDPDLSYDAGHDRLVLLYRQVFAGFNVVYSRTSGDGTHWDPPRELFRRRNHGIISPTIASAAPGTAAVWYVDAGPFVCPQRTTRVMVQRALSPDAVAPRIAGRGWTTPEAAGLVQPGYSIWHVDVIWVAALHEYWAVYPAFREHTCETNDLFFARSTDGMHWTTYPIPFLARHAGQWSSASLYRSSLVYDAARDVIRIFLSGEGDGLRWHLGYVAYRRAEFLAWLQRGTPDPRVGGAGVLSQRDVFP